MAFDWLGVSKLLSDPRSVRGPVLFQIAGRAKMRRRSIGWQRHRSPVHPVAVARSRAASMKDRYKVIAPHERCCYVWPDEARATDEEQPHGHYDIASPCRGTWKRCS